MNIATRMMAHLGACTAALTLALMMAVAVPTSAYAQKPPVVIVIVDMNALFLTSDVALDIERQVREQVQALQQEDQTTREAFAAEAETLRDQQPNLTPEEFQSKVADLGQRQQVHIQNISRRQQSIQLGQAQARSEVANVIKPIFAELLQKHGAGLLLDQANVLAGGLDLNITAEAMALLNQRLSSVTVTPVDPASLQGQ